MSLRFALPSLSSFGARLAARLAGTVVLLLLVCAGSAMLLARADTRLQQVVSDTLAPVADVGRIQNDYNDMLQAVTHAALTELPSSVDDAETQIKGRRIDVQKHWRPLRESGLGAGQRQLLTLVEAHRAAADSSIDEAVALLKSEQFDLARLKVSNDVENAFGPLKSDFSNLFALALAAGDSQATLQHVANRRGLHALILLVLAALGLTLWVDLRIIRSLTGRLAVAARVATRITQGSLGEPVEPGHDDEIGRLLRSLDGMDRQLAAVVGQVRDRACMLDGNAAGIADGNDALSRRTELQAMQLARTSGAMASIAATLSESARLGRDADRAASNAREQSGHGRLAVGEAIGSMEAIDRTSRSMGDMLDMIDQVAFQTRLLSLNAAIEAARAGEHGRGFGAVATEVRQLAQRSGEAARDIRGLVKASDDAVRSGLSRVARAGEVIESIGSSVDRLAEAMAAMLVAGRAQASEITAVNQAVIDMDAMTRENAALGEQAAAASRAMRESATALLDEVGFFTLVETAAPPPAIDEVAVSSRTMFAAPLPVLT
ncbi:HAMP domain-containing protein [Rhodanobacter denitrificans]|uniref:HAMP domain-containing protein n=1 Tax=Rhodanobacter denitrificans TaxID=666685 RepID=A0A368KDL4_9GAMM|nr:methyl-accepting chemotaxis protein [Rhodanobacter denitrificans]RCS29927.1 HAMP domain-containing protein [Rhodanobacter denitrificans]